MRVEKLAAGLCVTVLVLIVCGVARSDEVVLKTGKRHRGKIVQESETEVRLLVTRAGIEAELRFDRGDIARVVRSALPLDEYRTRLAGLDERSARAQDELATWCQRQALAEQAIQHALVAYRLDPTALRAQRLRDLGLGQTDAGDWVPRDELLARNGKVRHAGGVVSAEEAARHKAASNANVRRNNARARLRVIGRTITRTRREQAQQRAEQRSLQAASERLTSTASALATDVARLEEELEGLRTDFDYFTRLKREERAAGHHVPKTLAAQAAAERAYYSHRRKLRNTNKRLRAADRALRKASSRLITLDRLAARSAIELAKAEAEHAEQSLRLADAEAQRAAAERPPAERRTPDRGAGADRRRAEGEPVDPSNRESEPAGEHAHHRASALTETLRRAVVLIVVDRPDRVVTGSGFFVSARGHLVTNAHVVERARSIRAVWDLSASRDPISMRVVAVRFDPATNDDLALLVPDTAEPRSDYPHLQISATEAVQGTTVYAVGFPLAATVKAMFNVSASDLVVTEGILSALRRSDSGFVEMLQTDASIASGSSGGPLVNDSGEVIGVCTFVLRADSVNRTEAGRDKAVGSSAAFAIPAERIRRHFGRQLSGE